LTGSKKAHTHNRVLASSLCEELLDFVGAKIYCSLALAVSS